MNVYGEISQAIALLKLHGLFPFEIIRKSNQDERYETEDVVCFTFRWFGKNTCWGYILYTTVSIILYLLSRNESSNRLILYGYLVQGFVYYIGYMINVDQFTPVMSSAERINEMLVRSGEHGDSTAATASTTKRWLYWICFEIFCLVFFVFRETMFICLDTETAMCENNHYVLTMITIFAGVVNSTLEIHVSILYVVMTSLLTSYFGRVNRELASAVSCLQNDKGIEKFEFLRVLHAELCDVCDQLLSWFSVCLICIFGTLVTKSLIKVYLVAIVYNRLALFRDGSTFVIVFVYFHVLTTASQRLFDSSKELYNIVRNVNAFGLPLELQFQLRLAAMQSTILPINTKALGLVKTNRAFIPSMLSVFAIYVTVLIELEAPLAIFSRMLKRNVVYHVRHNVTYDEMQSSKLPFEEPLSHN